jgi:hypothetical protein
MIDWLCYRAVMALPPVNVRSSALYAWALARAGRYAND